MFWIIITRRSGTYSKPYYIEAGLPCNKGEIGFHLFGVNIVVGWKRY